MTEKVSDEMLMAYVDGELGAETADAIGREIEADPMVARRMRGFRDSRAQARAAYDDVMTGDAPPRLVEALAGKRRPDAAQSHTRSFVGSMALPLAACVAIVAGLGGYLAGRVTNPVDSGLLGGASLAEALATMRTGEGRDLLIAGEAAQLTVLAAYEVDGGLCRAFEARTNADEGIRGIGCGYGGTWNVDVAVAVDGGDAFIPASSGAAAVLDAFLDAVDASGPLAPDEESRSR